MVSVMKSPNMMSTTGRRPVMAAPTPNPVMPASEIGVSITRSVPNSSTRPVNTLKGVPASATSSPRTKTRGSRRISSANASRIASAKVSARPGASGIDMLMHLAHVRVRSVHRELRRRFDRGLHVRLNPVQHGLLGEPLTQQPVGQRVEGIPCRRPMSFFLFGPVIRAVNVADVVTAIAIGVGYQEGRAFALARPFDGVPCRGVDGPHSLPVHFLGKNAEGGRPRRERPGCGFRVMGVLVVLVVLADVDHWQFPELRQVHHLVEHALAQRAFAEKTDGHLPRAPPFG